ncbi:MAG: B12-binding domain-containing radical SAM protein [Candidatus Freyarchaeota archaeon]|nr:B12-binding domain-containing radical SAM protein [Candidatus Freyrarchaeum guaymaensis]
MTRFLIIDATGAGKGIRKLTRDVIGSGARAVAGVLESFGCEARIMVPEVFFNAKSEVKQFDVLMCGGMSMDLEVMGEIVKIWRKIRGGVCIAGGPASAEAEKLLERGYDLVMVGEAEDTIAELLRGGLEDGCLPGEDELRKTAGVSFLSSDGVAVKSDPRRTARLWEPSIERVKDYPFYRVARVYVWCVRGCSNFYRTRIPLPDGKVCIECSKCRSGNLKERLECPVGIPPGCGYCSVPSMYGPPRSRSVESILREIEGLLRQGVRRIYLGASCFLEFHRERKVNGGVLTDPREPEPNYEYIEKLLMGLREIVGDKAYVSVENVKASLFTREAASLISEYLPKTTIHFGGETGSASHAAALGRPAHPREVLSAVKKAVTAGLRPYVYFIHGLPGQTIKTARQTARMIRETFRLGAEKITIYKFKPLPMSAFEKFREPPSASRSKASRIIVKEVIRINKTLKKKMIGETLEVLVAEKGEGRFRGKFIAYPLRDGPTVILDGKARLGEKVKVRIVNVMSDKLVEGAVSDS